MTNISDKPAVRDENSWWPENEIDRVGLLPSKMNIYRIGCVLKMIPPKFVAIIDRGHFTIKILTPVNEMILNYKLLLFNEN